MSYIGHPDPARIAQLQRLRTIVLSLPPPALPSRAELLADSPTFDGHHGPIRPARLSEIIRLPKTQRAPRVEVPFYIKAASTTLVVTWLVLIALRMPFLTTMSLASSRVYTTSPGESSREVTLPDHSKVTLSGSTELAVLFSEHRRYVVLKKGEALFKVKHDPDAPFEVEAGAQRITDLGTTFDVRRYSNEVVVSVTEGTVALSPLARATADPAFNGAESALDAQSPRIHVNAGEQLSYTATGEVGHPHPIDLEAVTSWLYGHRVYRGKPLSKVIEDVQLYTPRLIQLDPALASVRYSGYLDQRRAEEWVRGLPTIYPVEIDASNPHRLIIRCRSEGCPEPGP